MRKRPARPGRGARTERARDLAPARVDADDDLLPGHVTASRCRARASGPRPARGRGSPCRRRSSASRRAAQPAAAAGAAGGVGSAPGPPPESPRRAPPRRKAPRRVAASSPRSYRASAASAVTAADAASEPTRTIAMQASEPASSGRICQSQSCDAPKASELFSACVHMQRHTASPSHAEQAQAEPEEPERQQESDVGRAGMDESEDGARDDRRGPDAAPRGQRREEEAAEEELLDERGSDADEERDTDQRDVALVDAERLRQLVVRAVGSERLTHAAVTTRKAAQVSRLQPSALQNGVGRSPKSAGRGVPVIRAKKSAAPTRQTSWTTSERMFDRRRGVVERSRRRWRPRWRSAALRRRPPRSRRRAPRTRHPGLPARARPAAARPSGSSGCRRGGRRMGEPVRAISGVADVTRREA